MVLIIRYVSGREEQIKGEEAMTLHRQILESMRAPQVAAKYITQVVVTESLIRRKTYILSTIEQFELVDGED